MDVVHYITENIIQTQLVNPISYNVNKYFSIKKNALSKKENILLGWANESLFMSLVS